MGRLIRAISENGGVLFCAVDATDIVRRAEQLHKTSAVTSAALGRLLAAGAMMGAMLKSRGDSLTLRVKADGPAGLLLVVADGAGHVKGYVEHPVVELPLRADGKLDVGGAVGHEGSLTVIRDMGLKEPYIGQVPLVSGEIAQDITSYYAASEQTPTVCALGVLVDTDLTIRNAGGFLLQLLPGATEEEIARLEANIAGMQSVTQMLSDGMTLEEMMAKALAGFDPQVLDEEEAVYACDCSSERVERALLSLGHKELSQLAAEDEPVEVCCQFCDKKYCFDAADLLAEFERRQKARREETAGNDEKR